MNLPSNLNEKYIAKFYICENLHHIIKVPVVDPAPGGGEKHEIYAAAFGGHLFTARKRNLRRLCFYSCLSVHRGACVAGGHPWQGGVHGRGACMAGWTCMAEGACMAGGVHGRGACMEGVCVVGHGGWGVCMAGEHAWQGACVVRGMPGGVHACPPADTMRYSDAVNEWAVCILLECIPVHDLFLQGQGGHGPFVPPPSGSANEFNSMIFHWQMKNQI